MVPQKFNKQTDRHTHTHMDKSTYRKHRPRGPMLWKQGICAEHFWTKYLLAKFLSLLVWMCDHFIWTVCFGSQFLFHSSNLDILHEPTGGLQQYWGSLNSGSGLKHLWSAMSQIQWGIFAPDFTKKTKYLSNQMSCILLSKTHMQCRAFQILLFCAVSF